MRSRGMRWSRCFSDDYIRKNCRISLKGLGRLTGFVFFGSRGFAMAESLLKKLVRNFPENGPKLLLENAANVRDLLVLLQEPQVANIDFTALTVERSHFVQPDYAHVAADLLLKAPLRVGSTGPPRTIFLYLLVE